MIDSIKRRPIKLDGKIIHNLHNKTKCIIAILLTLCFVGAWIFSPCIVSAKSLNKMHTPTSLGHLQGRYGSMPFKFIVTTDSHFGSWQGNRNSALAFEDIAQRHSDSAFLIHMGDITETGADEEYQLLEDNIAGLPFPVLPTMGNHESRWQDPQGSKFCNRFGPSTYSFDYGRWHFVVLDTTYPEQGYGTLDPSVLRWLEQDLASQSHKPVALFSHHPLLYQERNFQDSDDALLELIDKYPICAIFSGHGHSFIPWKMQGRSCFMSGALMDNAYTVVETYGQKLRVYSVEPVVEDEQPSYVESLLGEISVNNISFDNPIKEVSVEVENDTLNCAFDLLEHASLWFQIDGGYYNELGNRQPGTHDFAVDISSHAPGAHTLRIKAVTADSPYISATQFEKDTASFVLWRKQLGSSIVARMLFESPYKVILGTRDGMVYSFDPQDGNMLWQYDAGSAWGGGVIDGRKLYFGTSAGEIHCIDKNTGRMTWKTSLDPFGFVEPPLVYKTSSGKFVFTGSSSGNVYALNSVSGVTQWTYKASGAVTNTPSAGLDMIFFGDWDQKFYALYAATGQEAWVKSLGRQVYYSPAGNSLFSNNTVFTVTPADSHSGGSFVYALDPNDGQEIWKGVNWRSFMEPTLPLISQTSKFKTRRSFILVPDYGGRVTAYCYNGEIPWHIQGSSTLFAGVPNLDNVHITGGSRGVLAIHVGNNQIDFKVSDSFLFVDPLVIEARFDYIVLQGDNRGTITAIKVPVSP